MWGLWLVVTWDGDDGDWLIGHHPGWIAVFHIEMSCLEAAPGRMGKVQCKYHHISSQVIYRRDQSAKCLINVLLTLVSEVKMQQSFRKNNLFIMWCPASLSHRGLVTAVADRGQCEHFALGVATLRTLGPWLSDWHHSSEGIHHWEIHPNTMLAPKHAFTM